MGGAGVVRGQKCTCDVTTTTRLIRIDEVVVERRAPTFGAVPAVVHLTGCVFNWKTKTDCVLQGDVDHAG